MVRGLALQDEGRDDLIDMTELILGKGDPPSGFRKQGKIIVVGELRTVEMLLQGAFGPGSAAVAHIGRSLQPGTVIGDKVTAESIAEAAAPAEFVMALRPAGMTDPAFLTVETIGAGIVFHPESANGLDREMCLHLLRNSGRILVQCKCDMCKVGTFIEFRFDRCTIG